MENGATPVYNVGGNNGLGGDSFAWIFGLLILCGLMNGGGGFFGGGNGNANAIQADVNRGFDNQNLQAQTRDIMAAVNAQGAAGIAATNQTFHDVLMAQQALYNETARDIAGLAVGQANNLARINECCCATKQLIMQNNYDSALRDAATNANFTAQIQGVKDMLYEGKINDLERRLDAMTTKSIVEQATAGVVRYPMGVMYSVPSPVFGGTSSGTTTA